MAAKETTATRSTTTTTGKAPPAPAVPEGQGPATGATTAAPATEEATTKHKQGSLLIEGKSPYFVPSGRYRGRVESCEGVKGSLNEKTPFYDCVCVILDDLVVQGRNVRNARLPWSGFLKQEGKSALRTIRSMKIAGCTFPDDDFENFAGLGTKDVELEVEEEEPFTPDPTDEVPEPKTIYRSRVAWVNPLSRGMTGNEIDAGERKTLGQSLKGLIKMAKSGPAPRGDDPNGGIPMQLDPKTGKMVKAF